MAARTRKIKHDDETRAKIQASHIIRRLTECMNGKLELNQVQFNCAKTLLAKVLPDLTAVELSGETNQFVIAVPEQLDSKDWSDRYGPVKPHTAPSLSPATDPDTKH